ncbi:MAG: flippase-like domain-containing protein [Reyranella sp.]|nr:flippase-like domain-containing protein [Reyranella sp.]
MGRRTVLIFVGFALGGVCLWLSSRAVDWPEAVRIFRAANLADIAIGIVLFGIGIGLRTLRWQSILAFRARVPFAMSLRALLAGYAVNSLLPARLGEFFRAHYLARLADLSRSVVLASIVVERMLDLLTVICALALGLALAGGGDSASRHVLIGGAAIATAAVLVLLLIVLLLSRHSAEDLLLQLVARVPGGAAIARRGGAMLVNFTQALEVVRTRHFLFAVLLTLPIWVVEARAMWSVCRAVGVNLDLAGMLSLLGGASLSTLVPTAPGYVGSYQAAFVVILGQFGVTATSALVAATAVQVYLIGSFTLLGLAIMAIAALMAMARPAKPPEP